MPTCLPLVRRRCHACASERFLTSGKFRVNADHKLIDVWLLALCTACGETTKLTVLERTNVRSVPAVTVGRAFTGTSAGIAPGSVTGFIGMQLVGVVVGLALVALIFMPARETAG